MASKSKFIDVTLSFKDKFTTGLDQMGKKLNTHQKTIKNISRSFEKTGKSIEKTGRKLTAGVTAPIMATAGSCVKLAADFEQGMDKVQSISGASGKEMDTLSKKAMEMGEKTKFSATESADAFSYMAMAGWKTADMLDGIEGVMYLAGATGEDLATTSDIVTDALTAFGMKANETNRFVDVLAAAANNSNTNVSMMGESFKYVAPLAGALNYSVEDVGTALGVMANSGIKASNAGTALRSLLTNLAKPTDTVEAAMKKLGISMTDQSGKMKPLNELLSDMRKSFSGLTEKQKAQYAASIAGKTGMSGLLAIVNTSEGEFNKLSDALNNSKGAAQEMYNVANDNLSGKLTELKSKAESLGTEIGNKLTPYVGKLVEGLKGLIDKVKNLDEEQVDMIIKIAGVVAVMGPALIIIGKVTKGVGKFVGGISKVIKTAPKIMNSIKGIGSTLGGVLNVKIMLIVGAISLVAAGVFLLIKNWDKIKPWLLATWEKIKGFFTKIGEWLTKVKDWATEKFTAIKEKIQGVIESLKLKFEAFREKVRAVFDGIKNAVLPIIDNIRSSIQSKIDSIKQIFSGIIDFVKGVFTGNWTQAWEGVKNIFGGVFSSLSGLIKRPLNAVISLVNMAINGLNKLHVSIPDWVPGVGGQSYGINIPNIPYLAKGTNNWKGGSAVIHDKGAEIVDLPQGSRVIPHDRSLKQAYNMGKRSGNSNLTIAKIADTVVIREDADIDRLASAIADKLDDVAGNYSEDVA